jgi:hypothetical protein
LGATVTVLGEYFPFRMSSYGCVGIPFYNHTATNAATGVRPMGDEGNRLWAQYLPPTPPPLTAGDAAAQVQGRLCITAAT